MIYEIVKYDLIGATLYTKKERPDLRKEGDKFFDKDNREAFKTRHWEYTDNPNKGAYNAEDRFLPYFADVVEDLPHSITKHGHKPTEYKNCQLMVEKHGGYLQFWHEETKQVLRIALNSHNYTPTKQ